MCVCVLWEGGIAGRKSVCSMLGKTKTQNIRVWSKGRFIDQEAPRRWEASPQIHLLKVQSSGFYTSPMECGGGAVRLQPQQSSSSDQHVCVPDTAGAIGLRPGTGQPCTRGVREVEHFTLTVVVVHRTWGFLF